jgi:hypothetical protein
VRSSPVLCTRSPTPATVLIAARHATPATCTPRDKQTRFSNKTKVKQKQNKTIPDSSSNLAKSMTHHNQTKELTTWFLNVSTTAGRPSEFLPLQQVGKLGVVQPHRCQLNQPRQPLRDNDLGRHAFDACLSCVLYQM